VTATQIQVLSNPLVPRPAVEAAPAPVPRLIDSRTLHRHRPTKRSGQASLMVLRIVGPLVVALLWQALCSFEVVSERTLASPLQVLDAARELWGTGDLQSNLTVSLERVLVGLFFGVSVGLALAIVSGLFRVGESLVDPAVQLLRAVPILGLVPLVIIWFGVGETSKIFLIALGTTFPVYLNTYAAIRGVDGRLVEAASSFGLGRLGLIGRVILPGAVPGFLVGLRFALVGSWLIIVVAEQINAQSGLGYLINQAQAWYRTDIIVLALVIYGLLGLAADGVVRILEHTLLSWRDGFDGT
jgi:sulfonate transport system permease protein